MNGLLRALARLRYRQTGERGMVTVEAALVLPVLIMLALAGVAAVQVGQARVRCSDAATQAARALARGDPGSADRVARLAAGRPVQVSSSVGASDTTVTVRLKLRAIRWLAPVTISETAVVATEPAAGG